MSGGQGGTRSQVWLPELGMYYYKARMYSPTLGRFMQTDPIGYEDQVNLYAYVGNDPINGVDPTGMYKCEGSEEQCAAFRSYLRSLDAAIRRSQGSKRVGGDRRLLAARSYIGTNNDKGPRVTFENESGNIAGSFTRGNSDETSVINLDLAAIGGQAESVANENGLSLSAAAQIVGGAVVAHEGFHGADGAPNRDGFERYFREFEAYQAEAAFYLWTGVSGAVNYRNIGESAWGSCVRAGNGGVVSKIIYDGCYSARNGN